MIPLEIPVYTPPSWPTSTKAAILAIETVLPRFSIGQSEAAEVARYLRLSERWHHALPKLYAKSGVDRRGSVLLEREIGPPGERQTFYRSASPSNPFGPSTSERMSAYAQSAGPMLVQAAERALRSAGVANDAITHLVTISCTGFAAPGVDFELIRHLPLSTTVQRIHIGFMGCHAALNGLNVARSIIAADPTAVVLLGAVELCSLHQQYSDDPQQLVANALFADGAAAVVLVGERPFEAEAALPTKVPITSRPSPYDVDVISQGDSPNRADLISETTRTESLRNVLSNHSFVVPETDGMMSWTIGDHGFRMSLDPQVPSIIQRHLKGVLEPWLDEFGLRLNEIGGWAIHPGGPRIVESVGCALALPESALAPSLSVLAKHGNMSSPTVLFIIQSLLHEQTSAAPIVALAFGPGLCIEACLLGPAGS